MDWQCYVPLDEAHGQDEQSQLQDLRPTGPGDLCTGQTETAVQGPANVNSFISLPLNSVALGTGSQSIPQLDYQTASWQYLATQPPRDPNWHLFWARYRSSMSLPPRTNPLQSHIPPPQQNYMSPSTNAHPPLDPQSYPLSSAPNAMSSYLFPSTSFRQNSAHLNEPNSTNHSFTPDSMTNSMSQRPSQGSTYDINKILQQMREFIQKEVYERPRQISRDPATSESHLLQREQSDAGYQSGHTVDPTPTLRENDSFESNRPNETLQTPPISTLQKEVFRRPRQTCRDSATSESYLLQREQSDAGYQSGHSVDPTPALPADGSDQSHGPNQVLQNTPTSASEKSEVSPQPDHRPYQSDTTYGFTKLRPRPVSPGCSRPPADPETYIPVFDSASRKYLCPSCRTTYNKVQEVRFHLYKHLYFPDHCRICSKRFSGPDLLKRHYKKCLWENRREFHKFSGPLPWDAPTVEAAAITNAYQNSPSRMKKSTRPLADAVIKNRKKEKLATSARINSTTQLSTISSEAPDDESSSSPTRETNLQGRDVRTGDHSIATASEIYAQTAMDVLQPSRQSGLLSAISRATQSPEVDPGPQQEASSVPHGSSASPDAQPVSGTRQAPADDWWKPFMDELSPFTTDGERWKY